MIQMEKIIKSIRCTGDCNTIDVCLYTIVDFLLKVKGCNLIETTLGGFTLKEQSFQSYKY